MGFFGKKKTIIVSSTVYNLAGDELTRPDFLKNTIYAAIMSPHEPWLGDTIVQNLLSGPGMNQRHFIKWAIRQEYPGLPTFSVSRRSEVDPSVVAPFITTPGTPAGLVVSVQSASLTSGDYGHVVEQYILDNNPSEYDTDYVSNYNRITNEITIQWELGGSVTFSAGSWDVAQSYVVAHYYHYLPEEVQDLVTGSTTNNDLNKPDTTGYSLDASANTGIVNYEMTYDEQVVTTYTGEEPPTLPTDTDVTTYDLLDDVDFNGLDEDWSKITYEGGDGGSEETINKEHFLYITEARQIYTDNTIVSIVVNEDTPVAGQTETIVTRRVGDHLRPIYSWRIDTQETILKKVIDGSHVFSYELGTGEATLDALLEELSPSDEDAQYFPYMPIRLDNKSITHADYDDLTGSGLYEKTNRAYRRATGGAHRFSKLVAEVEDNESIDDIDYSFTQHGVALNVIEPACRKYMYEWFANMMAFQTTTSAYMPIYSDDVDTYTTEWTEMNAWIYAQGDPARNGYGDARPSTPKLNDIRSNTVRLRCADSQLQNLDMRITWVNITEIVDITGTPTNPDTSLPAVEGDIWLAAGSDLEWTVTAGVYPNVSIVDYNVEQLQMYWQTGPNTYKKLILWGLLHQNFVYGGESVDSTGKDALTAPIDEPTGFIIPLHFPTVKDLGLVDATQMATANTFIIFNSYEIVKQKWYQTFVGMLIIFIVIVAITVLTGGLGAGAGVGILGTNAAVGAAVGLTGTAAILAGAIINALVAIAISQIVSYGSKLLFGDKWGAIIATVINLAISMGASGGFSMDNLSELMTAGNILKIASAIANGYGGYVQGAVAEIGDDMQEMKADYEAASKKIDKLLQELRGGNSGLNFDPLRLTDSVKGNVSAESSGVYITETLDEFIHRTTMTGSDIADITLAMVNDYADLSLELP